MKRPPLTPMQRIAWDRWKTALRDLSKASEAFHAPPSFPWDLGRRAAIKAEYTRALIAAASAYRTCKDLGVLDLKQL